MFNRIFFRKEEAIKLCTLDSAYTEFMEARKGGLKKDYLGDMVIYDKDLMKTPPEEIMKVLVYHTIVGERLSLNAKTQIYFL